MKIRHEKHPRGVFVHCDKSACVRVLTRAMKSDFGLVDWFECFFTDQIKYGYEYDYTFWLSQDPKKGSRQNILDWYSFFEWEVYTTTDEYIEEELRVQRSLEEFYQNKGIGNTSAKY